MSNSEKLLKAILGQQVLDKDYKPQSRFEEIALSILNGTDYDKEPQSRLEELFIELGKNSGGGSSKLDETLLWENENPNLSVSKLILDNITKKTVNEYQFIKIKFKRTNTNANTYQSYWKTNEYTSIYATAFGNGTGARVILFYDTYSEITNAVGSMSSSSPTPNQSNVCIPLAIYGVGRLSETEIQANTLKLEKQQLELANSLGLTVEELKVQQQAELEKEMLDIADIQPIKDIKEEM